MSLLLVAFGMIFLAAGAFTGMARWTNPSLLRWQEAFQSSFGESGGSLAHLACFTLLPAIVGMAMLVGGMLLGRGL